MIVLLADVTLREYRALDAPALAQVFHESVRMLGPRRYSAAQVEAWAPAPRDPADVHARAADGRLTLVAVSPDGEILGYGDLEHDGHIDQLYCSPKAAGAGVAGQLLDALIGRAAGRGLTRLHVEASELARGLFERRGFVIAARQDFELRGVPIHNYAMARSLE